jgi:hypothetical protein
LLPCKSINHIQNKILPSSVNPEVLARELQGYKKDLFQTNIDGFTFGFKLGEFSCGIREFTEFPLG